MEMTALMVQRAGLLLDMLGAILMVGDQFATIAHWEAEAERLRRRVGPLTAQEEERLIAEIDELQRELTSEWHNAQIAGGWDYFSDMAPLERAAALEVRVAEKWRDYRRVSLLAIIGGASSVALVGSGFILLRNSTPTFSCVTGLALFAIVVGLAFGILSFPRLLPWLGYKLLSVPRRVFRTRNYFTALGFAILLLGFVVQFGATFLPAR